MGLYEISKSKKQNVKPEVMKALDLKTLSSAIRPMSDDYAIRNRKVSRWNLSRFGMHFINLYDLWAIAQYADILQIILNARSRETFRNGYNFQPKHNNASLKQKEVFETFKKKANYNGQSLTEVFKEILKDADWADDLYLLASKNYHINSYNEIMGAEVEEFIRLNPMLVELVLDKSQRLGYCEDLNSGSVSKKAYFDIKTRQLCFEPIDLKTNLPNLQAHYKVRTAEGELYYNESEILHKSLHNPSLTYGWSPLYSLYPKILVLITQDDFIRKYYGDNKPPKGFMIFNTDNPSGLSKIMDEIRVKSAQNPHEIFPIPMHNKSGARTVEYIDMSRTMQEMQYTENRNEFRNQIGAVYGVSPVFQNDISTSGGLNNEGLQITVTNRAIEDIQTMFNEHILPFVYNQLGITEWTITLNPSEEEDESFKLDLEFKELQNIKTRLEMGQKISQDKNGKFRVEPGELNLDNSVSPFIPFGASEEIKNDNLITVSENIEKAQKTKLPEKEIKQFETALEKELKSILKALDLSKKPTKQELQKTVDKLTKNLDKQLKAKSANRVKSIYQKTLKQVEKETKQKISLMGEDKNMIEALKRNPTFDRAFKDMSIELSNNLKKVITEAYQTPEKFTIDNLVKSMQEQGDVANNKLRQIARTESSKISMAARKVSYQKSNDFNTAKFKVIGPDDNRTGEDSKKIKSLVGDKGKSWDEIVRIIQNIAGKNWEVNKDYPIPRPNWRHVIVKVV